MPGGIIDTVERHELMAWLKETDPGRLEALRTRADAVRAQHVGPDVHFRGLIEFSNICRRACWYCGIRAGNAEIQRYRLGREHILQSARLAHRLNFGSIVLQSGEDPGLDIDDFCDTIRLIKDETGLAITLSLGERTFDELARMKMAGADRYLLRFETSNSILYDKIHPKLSGQVNADRFEILRQLAELGYEVGTGVMVGIPGSTWEDLATDIELFGKMDIDMIGIGPFIPHPKTPLGRAGAEVGVGAGFPRSAVTQQPTADTRPPNTSEMVLKVLALTRIMCPDVNIPSTTALETADPDKGYENGLCWGANVIMPNLTAMEYRRLYEIYPGKTGIARPAEELLRRMTMSLQRMGRSPGTGPGRSIHYEKRFFEH